MAKRATRVSSVQGKLVPLVPAKVTKVTKSKPKSVRKPRTPKIIDPMHPTQIVVELPHKLVQDLIAFSVARDVSLDDIIRVTAQGILKRSNFFNLDTELKFGKYAGESMEAIIRLDPNYIDWMLGVRNGMTLSPEATTLLEEMLNVE